MSKIQVAADRVIILAQQEAAPDKMTQEEAGEFYRLVGKQADAWADLIQYDIRAGR